MSDGSWIILDTVEILGYSVVLLKLINKNFVILRLNLLGMCLMQIRITCVGHILYFLMQVGNFSKTT